MTKSQWSRLVTAGGAALLVAALGLGLLPSPANAASVYTAQSSGRGAQIAIGGQVILDSQTAPRKADTDAVPAPNGDGTADCVAASDPSGCESGPTVASIIGLPLLGNVLSAGVVAQDAFVNDTGTSKACSGLVGAGGAVSVDATPQGCVVANPTSPGGVVINLADGLPLGLFRIRADAVTAECSASGGDPEATVPVPASASGTSHLANVVVEALVPLVGYVPVATLPVSSAPNAPSVLFPEPGPFAALNALVNLQLNEQVVSNGGSRIDVTALHLTVLGAVPGLSLLDLKVGQVSCGTNTAVALVTTTSSSTSSSTTAPSSTSSSSSSSSTSSTVGSSTSSSSTSSTVASSTSSSSTSSTVADTSTSSSSTSSTVADTTTSSSTTSTTLDDGSGSTTSSSVDPSTTSSTAAAATTSSTAARAPLAKTGSNTRAQLSLALGLVGLGMVVTGRGMQLGFVGPDRRRRP